MNKAEFVAAVADEADISKTQAEKAVNAFIDTVTKTLKKGGEVNLVGFGKFKRVRREATSGRNPRTGAVIKISAKNQPKFQAGKALKDALN